MLKKIIRLFNEHPSYSGESYAYHMMFALFYFILFLLAALACFVHAFFPFLFTDTASSIARFILGSVRDRGDDIWD